MESRSELVCSLCLFTIVDKNFEKIRDITKEILDIVFTNKKLEVDKDQIICQVCSRSIHDAFTFKCSCIYTEDYLAPFCVTIAMGPSKINLQDVYVHMKNNLNEEVDRCRDDLKVCRLCLQLTGSDFTSLLGEEEQNMVQKYIPEIVIGNTIDPVACNTCIRSLHNHVTFINSCLYTQQKKNEINKLPDFSNQTNDVKLGIVEKCEELIRNINGGSGIIENNQSAVSLNDLVSYFKEEDTKLVASHSQNFYPYQDVFQPNASSLELKSESEDDHKPSILYDLDLQMVKYKNSNNRSRLETKSFDCKRCDYKSKYQSGLRSHFLNHHSRAKPKMHSCSECDYTSKYLSALKSHKLNHMPLSKIKLYSCQKCDYKTKYRNALKSHKLNHKLPSEIEMRKCNVCSYETKHRTALVLHMLKHKRPWEIPMYKCDKCEFQTKFKHALKPHKLKHKGNK